MKDTTTATRTPELVIGWTGEQIAVCHDDITALICHAKVLFHISYGSIIAKDKQLVFITIASVRSHVTLTIRFRHIDTDFCISHIVHLTNPQWIRAK